MKKPFPSLNEFREQLCSWQDILKPFTKTQKFENIYKKVAEKYNAEICYPLSENIFKAFELSHINQIKVVILGQDPYHQPNQAMGLCFSVPKIIKTPPSLINIYKAIELDPLITNFKRPNHGDLTKWGEQGVFLLNTVLTVTDSKPFSHKNCKWIDFTDFVISTISRELENIIFVLWGKPAQQKKKLINEQKHLVLESVHPSPLSASKGFYECGHFGKINQYLKEKNKNLIDWNLD